METINNIGDVFSGAIGMHTDRPGFLIQIVARRSTLQTILLDIAGLVFTGLAVIISKKLA